MLCVDRGEDDENGAEGGCERRPGSHPNTAKHATISAALTSSTAGYTARSAAAVAAAPAQQRVRENWDVVPPQDLGRARAARRGRADEGSARRNTRDDDIQEAPEGEGRREDQGGGGDVQPAFLVRHMGSRSAVCGDALSALAAVEKARADADLCSVTHAPSTSRVRPEDGFGLIEVLIAMTILAVGILALFAMFESGIRQISRASTVTTTGALADRELEGYVAMRYDTIGLPETLVTTATAPYSSDPAYNATPSNRVNVLACGTSPCTTKVPVQSLAGADGRTYRVDTYVTWDSVTGGRSVKRVTIVVRDTVDTAKVWYRTTSSFDASTGQ